MSDIVKLHTNNAEREVYDIMADLYAIIQSLEMLEKAYIKDSISAQEYVTAYAKLITQCKTCMNLLKNEVSSIEAFMKEYQLNCPAALMRVQLGVAATAEHGELQEVNQRKTTKHVAEAVQHFITLLDMLTLQRYDIAAINPMLIDLLYTLNSIPTLPNNYEGKEIIRNWVEITNKLGGDASITEQQGAQLSHELSKTYNAFYKHLSSD